MKYVMGIFFVLMGIFLILNGFDIDLFTRIVFNFTRFWPFIFIMIGISILSSTKKLKWMKHLNTVVGIIFILLLLFWNKNTFDTSFSFDYNEEKYEKNYFEILPDEYENKTFKMDFSAVTVKVNIRDDIDKIEGTYYGPEPLEIRNNGNVIKINSDTFLKNGYKIILDLPSKYTYNFDINAGAANFELKEQYNNIEKISIDAGAANIKGEIREGFNIPLVINTDSGALKLSLKIPENSTYFYSLDGLVKNTHIDSGLIKTDINPDIRIISDSGVSSISLKIVGEVGN
ncbi:hypothetical protein LN42_02825 [Marinitoga sp. 1137]|uniref:LiaF transmembrane domain-containing protein n=1 Tax=Marinitoga sp. 1137 TaxID=1545835 RepID=UPI00095040AA|nr:hypothetical protein [Marinitoga sp. 1137]APT75439.1 hypothetical protein LN42_02825 [Marinitoga sp. 1137]